MINNANEFMVAFVSFAIVVGGLIAFVDIPFKGKMPKIA